ncbi:MAG: LLM class flavin-dependent oxidoreductase [Alphaproteobacteria bacterium]|nr:LLM class flavin-dependent oxidoreductase [Alphaproteobacteria bacterium]
MEFGIFDHLDRGTVPLAHQYEERLHLIEAYDRAGFHAYHLAEHHATPLGMSPSPSVFLAAVAQRSHRLRFGPLVYCLSLYHPLRLLEEICMLDQLSGGRFEFGIGRGVSPIELRYYGVSPESAQEVYQEALAIILQGFHAETLDFAGKHFQFRDVPIELSPVQRPHPPLWYGVARPESTAWTARHAVNIVCNGPAPRVRAITERCRAEWQALGNPVDRLPFMGMSRFIVVAEREEEARAVARRAYRLWIDSFMKLWVRHGARPVNVVYYDEWDAMEQEGYGVAGTPDAVCETLTRQIAESGINYLACRFAFGDVTLAEAIRSLELFEARIRPQIAAATAG